MESLQTQEARENREEVSRILSTISAQRPIGYILLAPAIFSVIMFFVELTDNGHHVMRELSAEWSGSYGAGGGATSALPFYFGLMAIAGGYLIKGEKK